MKQHMIMSIVQPARRRLPSPGWLIPPFKIPSDVQSSGVWIHLSGLKFRKYVAGHEASQRLWRRDESDRYVLNGGVVIPTVMS